MSKAKRDNSVLFKAVLANDAATQAVLTEYRPKIQRWVEPILRREMRIDNRNPKMTYTMWRGLMDGPGGIGAIQESATDAPGARDQKAPCPKMIGEWYTIHESEITGDERVAKSNQLTFKAKLTDAQVRWNFLRSACLPPRRHRESSPCLGEEVQVGVTSQ